MTEYQITVFQPGGGVYFRTEWLQGDKVKARDIACDLGAKFGTDVIELMSRSLSRAGYDYEVLLAADVWHGGSL
ncbi:hypothetical protein [Paraburkholderia humisilvae]|uniref:Uncharacterized protein n=1 Tax=Paraburkholderia humisilvae TaxID=627669 RepID=A0A6J5E0A2_9BURK|nr:hypothetical protein [Paraburkholderia humisilvae]CAB3758676.1 hypothetical protein LMG29542_03402 [Paraburkholderia humisilvae]